ncbi:MAG TPA: LamG-like jellyroll fold domain-containing protein, partial [Verrucomicrobiae bacterium]|nr:LamG-like jellyroll fold domain-containing protein [Verrucomicrobiae bacterium]
FVNLSYGFQLYYEDRTQSGFRFLQSEIPSAGVFHHFAGTFEQIDSGHVEMKTYIDGVEVKADVSDGNLANAVNAAPIAIGSERGGVADFFAGLIDEVAIYNRVLSAEEIAEAYRGPIGGDCVPKHPPEILAGPINRTVVEGGTAEFKVSAKGTAPIFYQWLFEGQALAGAVDSSLVLSNVTLTQNGRYAVMVSNAFGTAISGEAMLTVLTNGSCLPSADLVAWWPAEGNARDAVGDNNGQLMNGAHFAPGRVGLGFELDGVDDFVLVPDSNSLDLTNEFSLACWFKATQWAAGQGLIDKRSLTDCNYGSFINLQFGFQLYFVEHGGSAFTQQSAVPSAGVFHYFVGTFRQVDPTHIEMRTYIDGTLVKGDTVQGRLANTVNSAPIAIGSERGGVADFFKGVIDEVAIYRRALSDEEVLTAFRAVRVDPCQPAVPPEIVSNPIGQTVVEGTALALEVVASGSPPLFYQWFADQAAITEGTNSVLAFDSIALNQSGDYRVVVSNSVGSVTSAVARVVVRPLPSIVRIVDVHAPGGGIATVPIEMVTRGTENAVGFSLAVNSTLFRFVGVDLADEVTTHATLILNTNRVAAGQVGIAVALSAGASFLDGTQQLLRVSFEVLPVSAQSAVVGFGDEPTAREVSDRLARPLPAVYVAGTVQINPAEFEGDVAPRPGGDKILGITDWVQLGRFTAGLDEASAGEFQRADCAPIQQKGNGVITVADWVQAGRFAAGLDVPTVVGGPTEPTPEPPAGGGAFIAAAARELSLPPTNVLPGGSLTIPVLFVAQGNENAFGFSVGFDTNKLRFVSAVESPGIGQSTLIVNFEDAGVGRVGIALALPTGKVLPAGLATLVSLRFEATTNGAGTTLLQFVDAPVVREAVDATATPLPVTYTNGVLRFGPDGPRLTVTRSGPALLLIWPTAPGFELYSSIAAGGSNWTKVPVTPIEIGGQMVVSVTVAGAQEFFRLVHP